MMTISVLMSVYKAEKSEYLVVYGMNNLLGPRRS